MMSTRGDIGLIYEAYKSVSMPVIIEHEADEPDAGGKYNTVNIYSRSIENPMELVYQADIITSEEDDTSSTYIAKTVDEKTIQVIIIDSTKETSVVIKDENGLMEDQFVERNIIFTDPDHPDELNILKLIQ
jgi:hypothetical protein